MQIFIAECNTCLNPRHLGSQLAEMENVIEKMMEADLVEFAVQDIRYRLEVCQNAAVPEDGTSESEVMHSHIHTYDYSCLWWDVFICL